MLTLQDRTDLCDPVSCKESNGYFSISLISLFCLCVIVSRLFLFVNFGRERCLLETNKSVLAYIHTYSSYLSARLLAGGKRLCI